MDRVREEGHERGKRVGITASLHALGGGGASRQGLQPPCMDRVRVERGKIRSSLRG